MWSKSERPAQSFTVDDIDELFTAVGFYNAVVPVGLYAQISMEQTGTNACKDWRNAKLVAV